MFSGALIGLEVAKSGSVGSNDNFILISVVIILLVAMATAQHLSE